MIYRTQIWLTYKLRNSAWLNIKKKLIKNLSNKYWKTYNNKIIFITQIIWELLILGIIVYVITGKYVYPIEKSKIRFTILNWTIHQKMMTLLVWATLKFNYIISKNLSSNKHLTSFQILKTFLINTKLLLILNHFCS